ncbi:pirin family protein [Methylomicrobium lacus]|uniref:pirin family protein n=1 Tax=Methylomicrobium lacus TaxID=136992 RepID=UPI0035A84C5E
MKKVIAIQSSPTRHWVGDGFPVRSLFSYDSGQTDKVSPFLLLDYAGPAMFDSAAKPRGVGEHPHRGFETVTLVYQGEVAHRDSTGKGGVIGPGDVQWMTAGSGILHQEFHSESFTRSGGVLEMVQLWVNLPAEHKMTRPRYQAILNQAIPEVELLGGTGTVRVIAGRHGDATGPAHTFSPMTVLDIRLHSGQSRIDVPNGWNTMLVVLTGSVRINGDRFAEETQLVVLDRAGDYLDIEASDGAKLLLLAGEPINEPVVGYGPFVMNTQDEIDQAIEDYRSGKFGRIPAAN